MISEKEWRQNNDRIYICRCVQIKSIGIAILEGE